MINWRSSWRVAVVDRLSVGMICRGPPGIAWSRLCPRRVRQAQTDVSRGVIEQEKQAAASSTAWRRST